MHAYRTRFAKDIVTEFLPPRRKSKKVVIICDGMPTVPSKFAILDFFSKKGYWAFHPRYRGSWESGGRFLERPPHLDILDVISGLRKEFREPWDGKRFSLEPKKIHVLGSSFGGCVALMASMDSRVESVVALSPVVDWSAESRTEPLYWLKGVVREAFGEAYRFSGAHWRRLGRPGFFNPIDHMAEMDGSKILLVHTKDDKVVPVAPATRFAKRTGCEFALYAKGGHLSMSALMSPRIQRRLWSFLDTDR